VGNKKFKKMSLMDLAAARVITSHVRATVKEGDLVEILGPFLDGEDYIGIVTKVSEENMHVYHSSMKKTIVWNRRVKCIVSRL